MDNNVSDVFIIESLGAIDEDKHRHEGLQLAQLLRLSGKNPKYFYFQSKEELPHLLELFKLSGYRYLHISCHASLEKIETTNDMISYYEFAKICKDYLKLRRVFFSACELGNHLFSSCLAATNKGMHSIVAPAEKIRFEHAAAIWSAFYISIFSKNEESMSAYDIKETVKILCSLFPVDFHISTYLPYNDTWDHITINKISPIKPGKKSKGQSDIE